jgi:hypothetical protein
MILGRVTMPVTRFDAGAWGADGEWTDGAPVAGLTITASVQPITPELMEDLPAGNRTSARFVMYAAAGQLQLITVDIGEQRRPDRILYRGRSYNLQSIGDWSAHTAGLPHQEYVMIQVGDDEPGAP